MPTLEFDNVDIEILGPPAYHFAMKLAVLFHFAGTQDQVWGGL
jgi:hypothetical protein